MKLSQLLGESILNFRDGEEQGPREGEESLVSASHLELGELLTGPRHPTYQSPIMWLRLRALPCRFCSCGVAE